MNVVMPMAGEGVRLQGYSEVPKPLIKINDYNMFLWSLQRIPPHNNFIFIVKDEHILNYDIDKTIYEFYPNAKIVIQDSKLDGAVMSIMLAESLIDNDEPLLIVDCDIFVDVDYDELVYYTQSDAALVVSENSSENYSYALVENGLVTRVAEKEVISNNAISGVYFWKNGSDYIKYAKQLIGKDIRTNNEFYVAPVFNEAIKDGKTVSVIKTDTFYHLGTKEDISMFLGEPSE